MKIWQKNRIPLKSEKNRQDIEATMISGVDIAWITHQVYVNIKIANTRPLNIRRLFNSNIVAMTDLAGLLNMPELAEVKSYDTHFERITRLSANRIILEFTLKTYSLSTKIYQVASLPIRQDI